MILVEQMSTYGETMSCTTKNIRVAYVIGFMPKMWVDDEIGVNQLAKLDERWAGLLKAIEKYIPNANIVFSKYYLSNAKACCLYVVT